jgi:glycosyltransferase involved in cell wall biosynthesis
MKLLAFTRYSRQGASSRQRILQYAPALAQAGWTMRAQPLFGDDYLTGLYAHGARPAWAALRGVAARLREMRRNLSEYDAIFVQYELLPYLPFRAEARVWERYPNTVVDFDDHMFLQYERHPWLRDKYPRLLAAAGEILAGNQTLRRYAARHAHRITVLPTVVDLARYQPRVPGAGRREIVIGWIGTPVTAKYLRACAGALREVAARRPVVLRVVGAGERFAIPGVPVDNVGWSEETEAEVIGTFDIGIMPLADDEAARGKCGYKLVQYMAASVAALGSAVGANAEIIEHGKSGLLASSPAEFAARLEDLIGNPPLRAALGRAGRLRVEQKYSLEAAARTMVGALERAHARKASAAQTERRLA